MLTYKEGKCALTHVHCFLNALTLNGETDPTITVALFGNLLVDDSNYNWFTTQRNTYPEQDLHALLDSFKHRYQEIDNDDQAYLRFRSLKQETKESVDDYYERMMKLASQFEIMPADNFLLSNFRASLLKYLHVATIGLPRMTLVQAKRSAKLAESGLPREPDPNLTTARVDQRRPICGLCKKHGHQDRDCYLNPDSEYGKRRAAPSTSVVVAAATPAPTTPGPSNRPPRDGTPRKIFPCAICQLMDHPTHRCPLLLDPQVTRLVAQLRKDPTPGTSTVVIEELQNDNVGVLTVAAITRTQTISTAQRANDTSEPTDLSAHEALCDSLMKDVRALLAELEPVLT